MANVLKGRLGDYSTLCSLFPTPRVRADLTHGGRARPYFLTNPVRAMLRYADTPPRD